MILDAIPPPQKKRDTIIQRYKRLLYDNDFSLWGYLVLLLNM